MPSAAELPSYEVYNTETPSPLNPLGAKGIGESATLGSTPAVHNAVVDALSHLGVRHLDMPCTAERVWRAMQEADARQMASRRPTLRLTESQYRDDRRQLLRRLARRSVRSAARPARRRRRADRRRSPKRGRAATPTRRRVTYTVDPRDMLAADARGRGARRRDRRRAGTATRTPTPYPSPTDVRQAVDPDWSLRDREPPRRRADAARRTGSSTARSPKSPVALDRG